MFSAKDLKQFKEKEIDLGEIEKQLNNYKHGFPFLNIAKAATIHDGIIILDKEAISRYVGKYDKISKTKKIVKFVPASGAASRMFKSLFEFMNSFPGNKEDYPILVKDKKFESVNHFFQNLNTFPFFKDLEDVLQKKGEKPDELIGKKKYISILKTFLTDSGLNYGNLPKGLLKFHKYKETQRTSAEEHLVEGANYCNSAEGLVYIHFTVSPAHRKAFNLHLEKVKEKYEKSFNVNFNISFSEQKPSTDTIAVDPDNRPFRNADGNLLFRPAGHGAILENLNDIEADIIFIKNIDNVVPDKLKPVTITYKKVLAGILLYFQEKVFNYLNKLENSKNIGDQMIEEINSLLNNELCIVPPNNYFEKSKREKVTYLFERLHRPIRVCGMVINEGEPGGGPFWIINADGATSLQIVESAQIDMKNPEQKNLFQKATHFNPVDLVCGVKDYQGNKFNLKQFRDAKTGLISKKSKDGKDLKAQELPGLWNGAMADWNTVFLEVPLITFNPVKTVNDLLRREHQ